MFIICAMLLFLPNCFNKPPQDSFEKFRRDICMLEGVSEGVPIQEKQKEGKEDSKKISEKATQRRPLKFKKFRVVVDIICEEPRNDDYVREETKKLVKMVGAVADAKDFKIKKLQGVSVRKDKEKTFEISLD